MPALARVSAFAAGRRSRWVVIGVWAALAIGLAPLQPELQEEAADESETFLVRGSESAELDRIVDERFRAGSEMAAVIAYQRDGGISGEDRSRIQADALEICRSARIPSLSLVGTPYGLVCGEEDPFDLSPGGPGLRIAPDGSVVLGAALMTDGSTQVAEAAAETIRSIVPPPTGDESGLRAYVTGEAGFDADRSAAVEGIDDTLLLVTVAVLLALLLAIYRSPLIACVPLVVVAVAYVIAAGLIYGLVAAEATTVSGQTTAILIVLMFGIGTDYCLLIVARFRDELRREADPGLAMARATERTGPAILTAGAIVAAAMLVLAIADFNATREMGPLLAAGVAVMVAAGLTLLPAVLAALGREAFWPAIPRVGSAPGRRGAWARVADLVARRPVAVAAAGCAVLAAGALGNLAGRETLDFSEQFREEPESVRGQQLIQERFGAGRAAPIQVLTEFAVVEEVMAGLSGGGDSPLAEAHLVARSLPPAGSGGGQPAPGDLALAEGYLRIDPFSDEATDAVPGLRERVRQAAGAAPAMVGGAVAEAYDTREALERDTRLIVPITLALVLAILAFLLRALVMPVYVIATVLLSFAFALGASSLVFTHLFGQPASDPSLALFAFIFLVALGVDYNVFLLARIREEREAGADTAAATTRALEQTGGVITSAGLVLAATFSVLMALELEALFQVGFVVALGLLVDTFLVRALIVPALAVRLGEGNWWPWGGTGRIPGFRIPSGRSR
jgi:putative drug exporter of the RND superfamily